jgi:hypothetical protein
VTAAANFVDERGEAALAHEIRDRLLKTK